MATVLTLTLTLTGMGETESRIGWHGEAKTLWDFAQLSPEQNRSVLLEPCFSSSLGRQQ